MTEQMLVYTFTQGDHRGKVAGRTYDEIMYGILCVSAHGVPINMMNHCNIDDRDQVISPEIKRLSH